MEGLDCPSCGLISIWLSTTNEWEYHCPFCSIRFNKKGEIMEITDGVKGKTPPQHYDFSGMTIDETMESIRENNIRLGWEDKERTYDEWSNLFHTEISEAYEEYRAGHGPTEIYFSKGNQGYDKPEGIPIELADNVIRIMHFFAFHGISLADAISLKMNYNRIRPYRHGNKKA